MKNKKLTLITILILLCFLVGCANSEFDSSYKQFKESYILATDFLEKDNDSLKSLKKMDINTVKTELNKMKEAMDKMNATSNSKSEKGINDNVKRYYQSVEFLLYGAKNVENLSVDEKRKVYTEAVLVLMNRENIKSGGE